MIKCRCYKHIDNKLKFQDNKEERKGGGGLCTEEREIKFLDENEYLKMSCMLIFLPISRNTMNNKPFSGCT